MERSGHHDSDDHDAAQIFESREGFFEADEIGEVMACKGIAEGVENTNYFLCTDRGEFVLTLFERLSADQLPYYLGLMQHLAARGPAVCRVRVVDARRGCSSCFGPCRFCSKAAPDSD